MKLNKQLDKKPKSKNFGTISEETSERFRNDFGTNIQETFDVIAEKPKYSAEEIAEEIGKTSRTVETYIKKLRDAKIIERVGPKLGGYWKINTD